MPSLAEATTADVSETILTVTRQAFTASGDLTHGTFITGDATGGAVTLTLPLAASNDGRVLFIKKIDASGNAVTVSRSGSDTIDGATSNTLATQNDSIILIADSVNSNWARFPV